MSGLTHRGRGAQYNPDNHFLKHQIDFDAIDGIDEYEKSRPQTSILVEHPKKIISTNKSPDLKMDYSINPYQGCEHGCVYCFARNTHQYWGLGAGLDFESKIIVKPDAPKLLERELRKPGWRVGTIMLSGNTDCYQPLERKYEITRGILKVLRDFGNPVGLITKNVLIRRDIDIVRDLAAKGLIHVYFSITTLDEELRRVMEPRTASIQSKLKAIEFLTQNGVPVGIMLAPIIPGLNHHEIPAILRQAADAGAQAAGYSVVRLNGEIGDIFRDWLSKTWPGRADKVWSQICEMHGGAVNDSVFGRRISGEGKIAQIIGDLFNLSKRQYLKDAKMDSLRLDQFALPGQFKLF